MSQAQAALRGPQLAWESYRGQISSARGVCVAPAQELGQKAQAEAHIEHEAHVRDAGGVKAQRLVESIRFLPSPKGAPVRGKRVWHRDVAQQREGRISSARGVRVAQLGSGGRRRRRERTSNIRYMSVTLEVSKSSGWLKALASCRVQRGHPTEGSACVARRCGTAEGRANQQRTRRACGPAREFVGRRRRRKRT